MAVIPLVHRNGTARASIRRGLPRRGVRLVSCRSLERARSLLERELVDAVVVDVRHGWAEGAFELAHDYPGIPVVAYSPFRPDDGALIAACRRAGLDTVLVEGVDDYAAGELIWSRCATRTRRAALADAPRMLRLTEPVQLRVWEEVLARVGAPTTTADIARALRRTREHLSREFAAGGAPNLKRVIDLARTAWAADLLANPAYSVTTVARILGFSSPNQLASTAHRVAGVTAAQLAGLGPRGVMLRFVRGRTRSRVG